MRIIAGKLKGATLHMLKDKDTRPLKDLARESIFNLLTHSNKISLQLEQSNILDLYAGTGSFGLECLSRQAISVCFIEKKKDEIEIL
jgi:16S rRNA (guanine966-N2)-methyltransferase